MNSSGFKFWERNIRRNKSLANEFLRIQILREIFWEIILSQMKSSEFKLWKKYSQKYFLANEILRKFNFWEKILRNNFLANEFLRIQILKEIWSKRSIGTPKRNVGISSFPGWTERKMVGAPSSTSMDALSKWMVRSLESAGSASPTRVRILCK